MNKATKATGQPVTNPYLAARREWNERYGEYIATAHTWRLVAVIALLIALCAVGGVVWIGVQSKFIPFVVEVNKLGEAVAVSPASEAAPADPRVIEAQLANWVFNMRTVYADATADRHLIDSAYAMIASGSPAFAAANAGFSKNPPWVVAQNQTVAVQIESVLPLSGSTWQVDWRETVTGRNGQTASTSEWQADVTVAVHPPTNAAGIIANPMGIYVTDFSWAKRL